MASITACENSPTEAVKIQLLLVDDEASVLKALRRLFFDLDVDVRLAGSGAEALGLLDELAADIVISDMRMPEMDGAELFTEIAQRFPETERILLTGYSDMESTVDAINRGKINYYVEKPWDDDRLRGLLTKSINAIRNQHKLVALEQQVFLQNQELQAWNEKLEAKVVSRTKELEQSNEQLQHSLQKVRLSYQNTVELFSALVEQRMGEQQINRRTIAWVLDAMAKAHGFDDKSRKSLAYAGILRNVGKLSFSDELLNTAYVDLNPEQQREFQQHVEIAANLMSSIPPLNKASEMLYQRQEYEDGSGYPNGLKAESITEAGSILSVVGDYFQYCQGSIDGLRYTPEESISKLEELAGVKYRVSTLEAFKELWPVLCERFHLAEEKLPLAQLQEGMVLSRNLYSKDAKLLLAEGVCLESSIIKQLKHLEHQHQEQWYVYIQD